MANMHTFTSSPKPFKVEISEEAIKDLHSRLDNARWPAVDTVTDDLSDAEREHVFGLGMGPTLPLMKELARGWRNFSWKDSENYLNGFNHHKVEIEEIDIHFLHERSSHADALPLIMVHGWPGSFLEFLETVPLLTEPKEPGAQAFHLVIPSMPGYAFSSPPKTSKWRMDDTARLFDKLMTGLGYETYAAQGGDWGSVTARCLGALYPEHCKAVHLNFCPVGPPAPFSYFSPKTLVEWLPRFILPDKQRERAKRAVNYLEKGSAYYVMQHLTPRTPAYALNDSPIGLLAWIGEKMMPSIMLASKQPNPTLNRDSLFMTCSLYWFTGSIGTSFLPYALNPHFATFLTDPKYHLPNFALSSFPWEIVVPSQRDAARTGNLRWCKEADDGGHFAALEKPEVFTEHVREALTLLMKA
ncbi:hypothetical protein JCM5296_006691 [Sporobolomyces johnsonii]